MVLFPKQTGKIISDNSKHVKVCENGIEKLGNKLIDCLKNGEITKSEFGNVNLHPKSSCPWAVDWIFVIDTLNFCFWSPIEENSTHVWTVENEVGYFALCAAINRAMKNNKEILNPTYYSKITEQELAEILKPDNGTPPVPLLQERVNCLHEVGQILSEQFNGTFKTCLQVANNSALKLLQIIVNNFPCFRDESVFNGQHVAFYKRAQILVADIWSCYQNVLIEHPDHEIGKLAKFYDINEITMFADYRVPQVLKYFGVLEYSEELLDVLNKSQVLTNGSEYELEIRGCSIQAIELLCEWIQGKYNEISTELNSILLDQYLWELRRKINGELTNVPFHRVISIYY